MISSLGDGVALTVLGSDQNNELAGATSPVPQLQHFPTTTNLTH